MSVGLMPADKLGAFWDPVRQELTLSASGEVQPITEHIHFVRQPWAGGLFYELIGTTYGVMGPKKPYNVDQTNHVSITPFPRDVIIKTANDPKGKPVPIFWGGLKDDKKDSGAVNDNNPSSTTGQGVKSELPAPDTEKIYTSMTRPFTIKQGSQVPSMGSVKIDFNTEYLQLIDAGINNNNIVWTFVAKKLGTTNVVVYVAGGIADYIVRIPYTVFIGVLDEGKAK